ncbi:MliC family protein [Dysgonomonas sp. BGC7]|uniref:MliC family protein n=1 Tax=Dysgonomonas sp. BGC7 TaxID=1658008 RepID=UPI00068054BB|nr:MliC family protein [Dysgonomonas sp. BGC7]MBD8389362.1 MliC family protein [Dysgonomonas sp. BGC7]
MKKVFLVFCVILISLTSCNHSRSNNEKVSQKEVVGQKPDEIKQGVETNQKGDNLEYTFNNTKNTATFIFNGEKIEMEADNTKASGANYKNDNYSYTNWQGITELKKDGKTIFYNNSTLVESIVKNPEGKTLEMKFDNSNNTASLVFNGKIIELKADPTASGIRYSNTDYMFSEHQGKIELQKNGKIIFSHQQ